MRMEDMQSKIRIAAEVAMFFGAFSYLAAAVREARFLGYRMFYENLVGSLIQLILMPVI